MWSHHKPGLPPEAALCLSFLLSPPPRGGIIVQTTALVLP